MTTHPPDPAAPRSAGEPEAAGRELDVKVAAEIFGWARRTSELNDEQAITVPPDWSDLSVKRWWGHDVNELVPYYSTDIAAAWLVVDHLQRQGFAIWLHWPDHGSMEPRFENWRAEIFGTQLPSVTVEANSAPMAICRAALRASADTPPSAGPSSSVA